MARTRTKTAAHTLAETILTEQGYNLDKTVKRQRRAGDSWATIADWITDHTHRPVTAETVRRWYRHIT